MLVGDDGVLFVFEVLLEAAAVLSDAVDPPLVVVAGVFEVEPDTVIVFGAVVEFFEAFDVDFESLLDIVSVVQSTKLHRSLQSRKHISVQFVVPPGHPQVQRSTFEL